MARPSPRLQLVARSLDKARNIHEYVVVERLAHRSVFELGATATRRVIHSEDLHATVFRDLRQGRGTATFSVARGEETSLDALTAQAAAQAAKGVGLPWRMPVPAAPARVEVAGDFPRDDPARAADAVAAEATRALESTFRITRLRVEAELASTAVITSRGFESAFDSTKLTLDGIFTAHESAPGEAGLLRCRARRATDLGLEDHVRAAAEHLRDRRRAGSLPPGTYDLLLTGEALVAGETQSALRERRAGHGWFGPIVAQSNATLARRGLTRYQPGQSIYGTREVTGDRLTLASDGTAPFGVLSRPFGDLGEPVRKFVLVSDGVAADLALDLREAALRGVTPNGGVRNLVVDSGTTPLEALARPRRERPLVEVARLAWLETDPRSGGFVSELGLGYVSAPGAPLPGTAKAPTDGSRAITGGAITGNVFDLFARARFSEERITDARYCGPAAIRVNDVEVR